MRLWHKSLINVLPKKQFLGQIRELTAICKDIQNNGKTNHILINLYISFDFLSLLFNTSFKIKGYLCHSRKII